MVNAASGAACRSVKVSRKSGDMLTPSVSRARTGDDLETEIEHRAGFRAAASEAVEQHAGGPLAEVGLVPNPEDVMARSNAAASEFTPLTASDLQ